MQREVFVVVNVRHQSVHSFVTCPRPFCDVAVKGAHRKEQVVSAHPGSVEDFNQDPSGMFCHYSGGGEVFRGERCLVQAWCGGNLEGRGVATNEVEVQVHALFKEAIHFVTHAGESSLVVWWGRY